MDKGAHKYKCFISGEKSAIAEIIEEYRVGLELYLYSIVGDSDLAEELTQTVFVKIFTKKPKYTPKASFKTWLYTIGKNEALNCIRKRYRTVNIESVAENELRDDVYELERMYTNKEDKIIVHRAMEKLKPEYREILWLTYFEQLSNKESAKILGKKVHTVEVLLSRARNSLKRQLEEDGFNYEI